MSLLLSYYPPQFITNQILRFFQVNTSELLLKQLDEKAYQSLHRKLLHHSTPCETRLNNSIQHPAKYPTVLQKRPWDKTLMKIRYKFQSGPMLKFSHQFFQWWHKYYQYQESSVNNVKLRLIPRTNRTLETFLVHKKPEPKILKRMEPIDTITIIK